jgi:hypothetical protein
MRRFLVFVLFWVSSLSASGAKYLIITHDNFYEAIKPLAQWKHKKGMPTKIVRLSEIGATPESLDRVKNYIVNAYNNWNPRPEYVLLVGGPNFIGSDQSKYDDYYGNMTGDYRMEIAVGRFPCANVSQCSVHVAKTLGYERTPYLQDTMWFKKGTGIVREDGSAYPATGHPDTVYWNDVRYTLNCMRGAGYIHLDSFSKNQGHNSTNVYNAIDDGRAFVVFRGQSTGLWWPPFTMKPGNTNNGFKLPVIVAMTCGTMSLSSYGYAGDSFLNVGSVQNPKGAVGYLGSTETGSGDGLARLRGTITQGFFRAVFEEKIYRMGDAVKRAKFIIDSIRPPNYITTRYREANLFGDPELNLWTAVPKPLTVSHDTVIPTGPQTFTVTVKYGNTPVSNALVCIMQDTSIYQYNYTNSLGTVSFTINPRDTGLMSITVTAHNFIPYENNVRIIPAAFSYDVGLLSIIQPAGIVAEGNIVPKISVKNYGSNQAIFSLTFKILRDGINVVYNQTISSVTLSPGETTRVSFPQWNAPRGNYSTIAYVTMENDQWHANDTIRGICLVTYPHDVGVIAILAPKDTISRGVSVVPKAIVKNFGANSEVFSLCFKIGNDYFETLSSINLSVNQTCTLEFPVWISQAGTYITQCYTQLATDNNRTNDTIYGEVHVLNDFLVEGFNNLAFPPTGWQAVIVNGTYNWERFTTGTYPTCTPYEGEAMAGYKSFNASSGSSARLITPAINPESPTDIYLKFYMMHDPGYSTSNDRIEIQVSPDGTSWNTLTTISRYAPTQAWQEHTVYLGNFSSSFYVGFHAISAYGNNMYIDNVRIIPPPPPDVGVQSIQSPISRLVVGTPTNVIATIKCYGGPVVTFSTRAIIIDSSLGNIIFSKETTLSLMFDSTREVNFGQFTPQNNKIYKAVVATILANDQDHSNDTLIARARTTPASEVDGAGYLYESNQGAIYGDTVTYNWIDASSGIELTDWSPNADDGIIRRPLPFRFPYYGQLLDSIVICTNGYLQFPTEFTSRSVLNQLLPYSSINNFIGALWDDLDLRSAYVPGCKVYQYNDPQGNFVVFQWDSVGRYNQPNQRSTFQIILYRSGKIKFQYKRVAVTSETSSTIGIQGGTGTNNRYQQYVYNGTPSYHRPTSGTAILFYYQKDAGVTSIAAPVPTVDSGEVIIPTAIVHNFGVNPESIPVRFEISDGYVDTRTVAVSGNSSAIISFAPWTASHFGTFAVKCSTNLREDVNSNNNKVISSVRVRFHDVGVWQIVSPKDTQFAGSLPVIAEVQNFYTRTASCSVKFVIRDTNNYIVYHQAQLVTDLLPDSIRRISFQRFNAPIGKYTIQCFTILGTDDNHYNDTARATLIVISQPVWGWIRQPNLPTQIAGKYAKSGARLVSSNFGIFALRGNRSNEFYHYNEGGWQIKAEMPFAPKINDSTRLNNKYVSKGSALCYDGQSKIYATKGGGTKEFWVYDIALNRWTQKTNIPPERGAKGGTALTFYNGYVYLLTGGRKLGEPIFYIYDTVNNQWNSIASQPPLKDNKPYKDGSSLTTLENRIYLLKGSGKNNYFYRFNPQSNLWEELESLPLRNPITRKETKVKTGGALANDGSYIYAIKGGGTNEFWRYCPQTDDWSFQETIPRLNKYSVPKEGASLTCFNGKIYLLKGNNTNEFWCYTPHYLSNTQFPRVLSSLLGEEYLKNLNCSGPWLRIIPLTTNKYQEVHYWVPQNSYVTLELYDIQGRTLLTLVKEKKEVGSYCQMVDFTKLSSGVYFIKYEGAHWQLVNKIVIVD